MHQQTMLGPGAVQLTLGYMRLLRMWLTSEAGRRSVQASSHSRAGSGLRGSHSLVTALATGGRMTAVVSCTYGLPSSAAS